MTHDTLTDLLERVQQATAPSVYLDVALECASPQPEYVESIRPSNSRGMVVSKYRSGSTGTANADRITFSVDAAMRYAKRLVPEHDYLLGSTNGGLTVHAQFGPDRDDTGYGETLALAIVAGALKAKLSILSKAN